MKYRILLVVSVACVMLLAACDAAKKTAAEGAIKVADEAYAAVKDQASQYVPDQAKSIQDSLQAAKDSLQKGEYEAALNSAKDLPGKIKDLGVAIKARKDELTAQWNNLSSTMPQSVQEVGAKVAALTKTHKLPADAGAQFDAVKQAWGDASTAFQGGNLADAMAKANAAKEKLAGLRTLLGMKPAA
jgi:gas vesicle protein